MMGLCLTVYLLASRLQPRRVAALGLLGLLVGAFFVTAELVARANRNEVIAVALFVGCPGAVQAHDTLRGRSTGLTMQAHP